MVNKTKHGLVSCMACLAGLYLFGGVGAALAPPQDVHLLYSEQSLEVFWDSLPRVKGYNVYTAPEKNAEKAERKKINTRLIVSGCRFTYIWDLDRGERVRAIKGREHHIAVTAVYEVKGKERESGFSAEVDNCYFENFRDADSAKRIRPVLADTQLSPFLPVPRRVVSREAFIAFMEGPGAYLHSLIKKTIDPAAVGGCEPITTVLIKFMNYRGLPAYKAEGLFIKEFHAFAVVNIEGVEYVLDFSADQFVPRSAPVLVPRDDCFINEKGRLSRSGTPAYVVGKLFDPAQMNLTDSKDSAPYRAIYDSLMAHWNLQR